MENYPEYKHLNLTAIADDVREQWKAGNIFLKSIESRSTENPFVFYEGPPSANGIPGIHHVMARAIKDIFCRYKTLKGFRVERKAGWDTHGLPIEIAVEKTLGITKDDIGKSISIEEYNRQCRIEVMKYKDLWDELTEKAGYWVDLENPYITFDNKYIESVWWLLAQLYKKGLLYKGYTIQPYSPAAGTGLSTHELNQPGCYKMVKDNTLTAQFKLIRNQESEFLFSTSNTDVFILAWTTTPWTLPSNTALAVGHNIDYLLVRTINKYSLQPVSVVLAKELLNNFFPKKEESIGEPQPHLYYELLAEFKGSQLKNIRYEQLLPYAQPETGDAFKVVTADFVTTEDGTGIVHIAPSFGADDFRTARQNGIGALTMVDKSGRFVDEMGEFAGRYVKPEYDPNFDSKSTQPVDIDIIVKLKKENKAFKTEKYEHSYPHCWRTDKPILYYPLDSWFIRTTAFQDRMIELNKTINWKPESTGLGRFGNWLENLVDWNLSRSRYWGVPLPIWTTEDRSEQICIESVEQLKAEMQKSVDAGLMKQNIYETFLPEDFSDNNYNRIDLHRPFVDEIILVSPSGKPMTRETDLIDVWFDSGAMPYAQFHYPFENKEHFEKNFPAGFIAEGVDQTRGWFFTLHAIAVMLFDSVAYKTCVSNGLVLDKKGNKMSKRLGNAVDPFETIKKYGPDATRWYMLTNAQPWDNIKFDVEGIGEVVRKFFGTLYNTYSFFALYANIDGFKYREADIPLQDRPEIDRWILSELNTLIRKVDEYYDDYEPTKAGRAIQEFVDERLSNWYVRLCRRRFWKGEYSADKISAYQTLYTCLETLAKLGSPIAPFYMDRLYCDLNKVSRKENHESVHIALFPEYNPEYVDVELEERMQMAQLISSMILSLRKKTGHRVRQPLQKIMIPVLNQETKVQLEKVADLILSETNVKELEYISSGGILVKKIKPNYKSLGPRFGKLMKSIAAAIDTLSQEDITRLEQSTALNMVVDGQTVSLSIEDVEIFTEDIPGWVVANSGSTTVALDITLTPALISEGLAREFINRIQNLRKDLNFDVTDQITIAVVSHPELNKALSDHHSYISNEVLAVELVIVNEVVDNEFREIELSDEIKTFVSVAKHLIN